MDEAALDARSLLGRHPAAGRRMAVLPQRLRAWRGRMQYAEAGQMTAAGNGNCGPQTACDGVMPGWAQ